MPGSAPTSRLPASRYVAFVTIAAAGLAADLSTKAWMFAPREPLGTIHWLWAGHIGLQTSLNEGALFGMGQGAVFWFAALSVVAAAAIPAWLFLGRAAWDWPLTLALGAVMGGVLGNLYDRVGLHGLRWGPPDPRVGQAVYAVRDWVLLQYNDAWRWPNFNIADALLVAGAIALVLRAWFEPEPEPDTTRWAADADTNGDGDAAS